jgi:hypothetical protein
MPYLVHKLKAGAEALASFLLKSNKQINLGQTKNNIT